MNIGNISTVYKKELIETLRDRRTLITSILIPLLLFPVLIVGISGLAILIISKARKESPTVMILGAEHAPELTKRIEKEDNIDVVPAGPDYAKQIDSKRLRAAVEFPSGFEEKVKADGETQTVRIYFHEGDIVRSTEVARQIERVVQAYGDEITKERLEARGQPATLIEPFTFEHKNVASAEKVTGTILGMMLPYMVIILALAGAMYPAIDLTAGEKERGTIETILTSPVGRGEIVAGKYFLVLTVSLVTTALSIASFAITVVGGATLLQRVSAKLVLAVGVKALVSVFILILPLVLFFSAALLAIAMIARNYREAQTYIGPLMFLVIIPAMVSFLPGVQLNTRLSMIPILNVSLVSKEILAGLYPWNYIALIFGSTIVYAGVAIYFAARQFQREEVLFRV